MLVHDLIYFDILFIWFILSFLVDTLLYQFEKCKWIFCFLFTEFSLTFYLQLLLSALLNDCLIQSMQGRRQIILLGGRMGAPRRGCLPSDVPPQKLKGGGGGVTIFFRRVVIDEFVVSIEQSAIRFRRYKGLIWFLSVGERFFIVNQCFELPVMWM